MLLMLNVGREARYSLHHTVVRNSLGVELLCHDCKSVDDLPMVIFSRISGSLEMFMEAAQKHETDIHSSRER